MKQLTKRADWRKALVAIIILSLLWALTSCKIDRRLPHDGFATVIHEECEYVLYLSGGVVRGMTHAGNCSNHKETPCKEIRYR